MPPKSKKTKASASNNQPTTQDESKRDVPNWPPLSPLTPPLNHDFSVLLENQILTLARFWTPTLCKNYTAFLRTLPLTTTPGKPKRGDAVRVNDRFQVQDATFAERLWAETGLRELVTRPTIDGTELSESATRQLWGGEVLGLNDNIRVYRYSAGQFFDQHCKWSHRGRDEQ